jgi:YVTN family beta-propeller protein
VARIDLASGSLSLFDLPPDSAGPVQIYPTPDGTHLWVADQGNLESRPAGNHLYRVRASDGATDLVATVGMAPHGVVVNENGTVVFATMLVDGTVQAVDANTGAVLRTTPVGQQPNGVTCAHEGGGMP